MKHQVRLEQHAKSWDTALPIGNGRQGALVHGKPKVELLTLNEETMWHGGPMERLGPQAADYVSKVKDLLEQGQVEDAMYYATIGMGSTPRYLAPFQPAGELRIEMRYQRGEITEYEARLDMEKALVTVSFKVDGVQWKREYFASRRDNVIAIRITSDQLISIGANLNRRPFEDISEHIDSSTTVMKGQCGVGGVKYIGGLRMVGIGATPETINDFTTIENAESVVLYTCFTTDFDDNQDYENQCLKALDTAVEKGFDTLLKEHNQDFSKLYGRLGFSLGETQTPTKSTAALLEELKQPEAEMDTLLPPLVENLFHYGRYLLISSSTDCQMPATLQGVWNGSFTPPWESKYTININTEMNYWLAGMCQLNECHLPLFALVDRMVERGQKTAKDLYGCRGFVAHHNTGLWADTTPEGILGFSPFWPMGGAWLAIHYFDHFDYTGDVEFLQQRALPVMEQAVLFLSDHMVENKEGYLVNGPSLSPENMYRTKDGQESAICMGPTMDIQIARQLLTHYIESCERLDKETPLTETAREMLAKLPPTRLRRDGRIMEWQEEYEEVWPGHRHISHLFGLHPGTEINDSTPELMEGAYRTIQRRLEHGGAHTGWSRVWLICMLARLKKEEDTLHHIEQLFLRSILINLFNTHPPYQIDGNLGFTAGVIEMIVQSHTPVVELLPALPQAWSSGVLTGVGLRGAMVADIVWANGKLAQCTVTAKEDKEVPFRYREKEKIITLTAGIPKEVTF